MRILYPGALTKYEALELLQEPTPGSEYGTIKQEGCTTALWSHPVVQRLADVVCRSVDAQVQGSAYCVVQYPELDHGAQAPHTDRSIPYSEAGQPLIPTDDAEMLWCRWTAVALLSPPDSFEGGNFWFRFPDEIVHKHEHYLSLVIYDCHQVHSVERWSEGRRGVLVMFFE
jgi:hypothetical protein